MAAATAEAKVFIPLSAHPSFLPPYPSSILQSFLSLPTHLPLPYHQPSFTLPLAFPPAPFTFPPTFLYLPSCIHPINHPISIHPAPICYLHTRLKNDTTTFQTECTQTSPTLYNHTTHNQLPLARVPIAVQTYTNVFDLHRHSECIKSTHLRIIYNHTTHNYPLPAWVRNAV